MPIDKMQMTCWSWAWYLMGSRSTIVDNYLKVCAVISKYIEFDIWHMHHIKSEGFCFTIHSSTQLKEICEILTSTETKSSLKNNMIWNELYSLVRTNVKEVVKSCCLWNAHVGPVWNGQHPVGGMPHWSRAREWPWRIDTECYGLTTISIPNFPACGQEVEWNRWGANAFLICFVRVSTQEFQSYFLSLFFWGWGVRANNFELFGATLLIFKSPFFPLWLFWGRKLHCTYFLFCHILCYDNYWEPCYCSYCKYCIHTK